MHARWSRQFRFALYRLLSALVVLTLVVPPTVAQATPLPEIAETAGPDSRPGAHRVGERETAGEPADGSAAELRGENR